MIVWTIGTILEMARVFPDYDIVIDGDKGCANVFDINGELRYSINLASE